MNDPSEALSEYNIHIQPIVRVLYELREIEHSRYSMTQKFRKARPLLDTTLNMLCKYRDFLLHRPLWNDLHDRMVYYYEYLNHENLNKCSMPLFRTTLHNDVVKWWVNMIKHNKLRGPLLHFDTHDDMQIPKNVGELLTKNGNLSHLAIKRGLCSKINYPVTCLLMTKKVSHVFWCMPEWVYDDDLSVNQYVSVCRKKINKIGCDRSELIYLRSSKEKKDKYLLKDDVKVVNPKTMENKENFLLLHPFKFDRVHTEKKSDFNKIGYKINDSSKYFILDIDLDYFVTNGDNVPREIYKKYFNDLESYYRVHEDPGIRNPQELYAEPKALKIKKALDKELREIEKRIDIFLSGLKILKNKYRLVPSSINFSDSTPSLLSADHSNAVMSNHYAPKYFVPFLHSKVIEGFHQLYGHKLFM